MKLQPTESCVKLVLTLALAGTALLSTAANAYDVAEKSISQIKADLAAGNVTSAQLVMLYEARIAALNTKIHAVIALNPAAPHAAPRRW